MIRGSREACASRVSEGVSEFVWGTRDAESVGACRVHTVQGNGWPHTLTQVAHANRKTPAEHAHATAHGVRKPSPNRCHNISELLLFQIVRRSRPASQFRIAAPFRNERFKSPRQLSIETLRPDFHVRRNGFGSQGWPKDRGVPMNRWKPSIVGVSGLW